VSSSAVDSSASDLDSVVLAMPLGDRVMRFLREAEHGGLRPMFQPVVALADGAIAAHELLTHRTSEGGARSGALFVAAAGVGAAAVLALRCIEIGLDRYCAAGATGRLFVKLPPAGAVMLAAELDGFLMWMYRRGLTTDRVVIELMEYEASDASTDVESAVIQLRAHGFGIALNSLGAGIGTTRLWLDLQPDYVKLDGYFTQGICRDTRRLRFVESMLRVGEQLGTTVVAHGLETEADVRVVRDVGIPLAQGYALAMPAPEVIARVSPQVAAQLAARTVAVLPQRTMGRVHEATADRLVLPVEAASPETPNDRILARFEAQPTLHAIAIVEEGRPLGLVTRHEVLAGFARPDARHSFGQRPCAESMQRAPLVVDRHVSVQEIGEMLASADGRHLVEGFIVVDGGRYVGLGRGQDLIREITRLQVEAARYANPLTALPGNVPIASHAERLLDAGVPFAACHFDLNHFKEYNGRYGYERGDQMIKLTGRVLDMVAQRDLDFLGHVGGDHFVMLLQSGDWERRMREALDLFGTNVTGLFSDADLARGALRCEDRRGNAPEVPLTSLAIGIVGVPAGAKISYIEVAAAAAEATRQAKKIGGNALFIERRRLVEA
jgi:diguanylate cyclase (GGDEF)-like protein